MPRLRSASSQHRGYPCSQEPVFLLPAAFRLFGATKGFGGPIRRRNSQRRKLFGMIPSWSGNGTTGDAGSSRNVSRTQPIVFSPFGANATPVLLSSHKTSTACTRRRKRGMSSVSTDQFGKCFAGIAANHPHPDGYLTQSPCRAFLHRVLTAEA